MPQTKPSTGSRHSLSRSLVLASLLVLVRVGTVPAAQSEKDLHSFANSEHIRVRHVDLDLNVDFERKSLVGHATLTVERTSDDRAQPLLKEGASADYRLAPRWRWDFSRACWR